MRQNALSGVVWRALGEKVGTKEEGGGARGLALRLRGRAWDMSWKTFVTWAAAGGGRAN